MRSDEERLLDILDESRLVLKYVPASRISPELRSRYEEVPWQSIIGMRHRVVHDYFYIDLSVVWRACTADVPTLVPQVETIVRDLRNTFQQHERDEGE